MSLDIKGSAFFELVTLILPTCWIYARQKNWILLLLFLLSLIYFCIVLNKSYLQVAILGQRERERERIEFLEIRRFSCTTSLGYYIVCTLVSKNTCSLLNLFAFWVSQKIRVTLTICRKLKNNRPNLKEKSRGLFGVGIDCISRTFHLLARNI